MKKLNLFATVVAIPVLDVSLEAGAKDKEVVVVNTPLEVTGESQGGPLGEGQIEDGCLICPWHGYEYDPITGEPPEGYDDVATAYPFEERRRAVCAVAGSRRR